MADNYWRNQNVFITGCTGLLGSWLTKLLVEGGANVVGLVRDAVPSSNLYLSGTSGLITSVLGEVEDYALLERIINEYEIGVVFHLAAQTIVGTANRNPVSTFETNIKGTWNLLEACRRNPLVKKVIVASSDKAYGVQEELPYSEDTPLTGTHPYDVSKSCADLLARSYFVTYKLPVCVTRCGNFFGGGDLNWNRIIPGTIRSVIFSERPIIRSDGTYVRDYFYVNDGAIAYMHLARAMDDQSIHGEAFNFSTETPVSVREIVGKVLAVMGTDLEPDIRDEAKNEIARQYLSAEKARRVLDWSPEFPDIADALSETIAWYRNYFGGTK